MSNTPVTRVKRTNTVDLSYLDLGSTYTFLLRNGTIVTTQLQKDSDYWYTLKGLGGYSYRVSGESSAFVNNHDIVEVSIPVKPPVTVNVNSYVKVKLLPIGLAIHQAEHEKYCPHLPYTPPAVDADGYSEFQLHSLMNTFGHIMFCGFNVPFETDIIFAEYKTNE